MRDISLTRRALLARAAAGAGTLTAGSQLWPLAARAAAGAAGPALPTPGQIRADVQRMVDFGPRLTGSDGHNTFIAWLEREFTDAGATLLPCDVYETSRWEVGDVGLEVAGAPVKVGTYFPRSKETPPGGVTGPLVYGGSPPPPSVNAGDPASFQAALSAYPNELASWAQALPGTVSGSPQGAILLVDLPMPIPTTAGILGGMLTYYNGQGESEADLLSADYKRMWLAPGLAMPLAPFAAMGVAGVVFVLDCSYEALRGQYIPFEWQNEDVPALYVDRQTGDKLRSQAASRPQSRLTLTATRKTVPSPSVTAVLPGSSDETIIFNTHTDGQGFVEENGGVAFVHLARYFAQRRLKRTLVFAAWPGHMSNDLPQAQGWIDAHKDLVDRCAAALTVEHLGCTEWNDDLADGYHPTGKAELFAIWTTQGAMFDLTRAAVVKHDLPRTALLRPPAQFGVGLPFFEAGIPEIGAIAGPEYLLTISPDGEMPKFDEALAAKQIAALADLAIAIDPVSRDELRQGDPSLAAASAVGAAQSKSDTSKKAGCTPPAAAAAASAASGRALRLRWYGHRDRLRRLVVGLSSAGGTFHGVTIELRRAGRVVAQARLGAIGAHRRQVALHRPHGRRFARGPYTVVARDATGAVVARRTVHVR